MASQNRTAAVLCFGLCALLALLSTAQANDLNDQRNIDNGCNAKFNQTLATLYKNDTDCANLLYNAFLKHPGTTGCPSTKLGSPVHLCMNKNDTNAYTNAWADLIMNCEYMYIANRLSSGESEASFQYQDDSCFDKFTSWGAFSSWLYDASPYGGKAGSGGDGAMMVQTAVSLVLGALVLSMALLW